MDMRMLVSISRVMGVLTTMSIGVGMTSAIGMNMLMLMVAMVSPAMGMAMDVAVTGAVETNMFMLMSLIGTSLNVEQGRLGHIHIYVR
jgi:hypothetical protein